MKHKKIIIESSLNEVLSSPIIDMMVHIATTHVERGGSEASENYFELYQFSQQGIPIFGIRHSTETSYTRVEMRNDVIILPSNKMSVVVKIQDVITIERSDLHYND